MQFSKLIKISLVLGLCCTSANSLAAWYQSTGTSAILDSVSDARNQAVNDAIRNVLLQAGADVKIEQTFENGVLKSDNVNIRSRTPIRKIVVLEEQKTSNKITVNIKVLLDEKRLKPKCSASRAQKSILPVTFKFADSEAYQGSIGIENIPKELNRAIYDKLANSSAFNMKTVLNANLADENRNGMSESTKFRSINSLANRYGSQYVMVGKINSVALSQVGNTVTKLFYNPTRTIDFDIDVYDAINSTLVLHKNYQGEADWEFDRSEYIDLRSDRFKGSAYGQRIYDLANYAVKDIVDELQCQSVQGKVIDLAGDEFIINLGRDSGIQKGMKFTLEQSIQMNSQGYDYNIQDESKGEYVVVAVYPKTAKLRPVDLQNNILNVNINDIVSLK